MPDRLLRPIGLLLMLIALAVPLTRAPDRPVESLVARWAPPPSDFMDLKGQLVHWRDEGPKSDPVPIVLLHGVASSLHTWEGWASALRSQRRVITLDLPGFGLTGPFAGSYASDDYRGDTYARFVLDLLDALKLTRVIIGGHGLGGEVAWRVATIAPGRVDRLILVAASGYVSDQAAEPLGFTLARWPVVGTIGQWLLPRALVSGGLEAAYADPARVTTALIDRTFEMTVREGNRRALHLRLQQEQPGQDAARIATIKRPTLILWGRRDAMLPPSLAQRFQADITGSRVQIFDALGTLPQEEDPVTTVAVVKAFLARE